jgi:hypothetical protein
MAAKFSGPRASCLPGPVEQASLLQRNDVRELERRLARFGHLPAPVFGARQKSKPDTRCEGREDEREETSPEARQLLHGLTLAGLSRL